MDLLKRMLLMAVAMCLTTGIQGKKAEELSEDTRPITPVPVYSELTYQILNADHLFLRDTRQASSGNFSRQLQQQPFLITGLTGQPAINVSHGPMSVEQAIPLELVTLGPRVRAFILARQVRSSSPVIRLLFYATSKMDVLKDVSDQVTLGWSEDGHICITAHGFWESQEVRGTCSVPASGGFCLAQLMPEAVWFSPGSARSSREQRSDSRGTVVELYYQTTSSPTSQCVPQESKQRRGPDQVQGGGQRSGFNLKKIGNVNLLRSPPGNPTFMRLRLGGTVIVQTSSKPLKTTDTATFYVFLSSTSPVEHFILRATAQKGMSFSTARPSDPHLWDIALEPGRGSQPQTISVICQRRRAFTGKRGLLEVLQLDFESQEQSDQLESQIITWRLELPANTIEDEGTMRIYTIQRDYVGIAPLITSTELLNTAVLTGKKVSVAVRVLGVEADGSVSDITNYTRCTSTHEDTLKVSERCDSVYMSGEETRGRMKMMVNFTYSYLSAQLEVSVWMPYLPLQIDLSDPELSQIKGWRVPVFGVKRASWESEEDDEKKGRGCMLQYQHSLVRVLAAFTANEGNSSSSSPTFFPGPGWLVDVTRLVRYSLRVRDTRVAQLQAGTVLSGRAAGVTTLQVMSPLSDAVLAERTVRVLDDKVSITELGVQLVSGLSLNLQLSPGSNRAIVATTSTQDIMQNPKQEAVVACWVQFSDGSLTPLDLFDPSGYALSVTSLDRRVVSVRKVPGSMVVVVAEAEGQGLLLRAELAICEDCQKSKRKSKLAVGAGAIRVKFLAAEQQLVGESGRSQTGTGRVNNYGSDNGAVNGKPKLSATSSPGLVEILKNPITNRKKKGEREITVTFTKSILQEALGAAVSTIRTVNKVTMTSTKPSTDKSLVTVSPGSVLKKTYGNLIDNSDPNSQEEQPGELPPLVESDSVRTFGFFTDLEICIYSLVGVSCLAIIAFLFNCATHSTKARGKKSPVQSQGPDEHKHHWVRLGTPAEQNRSVPIVTTNKREVPMTAEMPKAVDIQRPAERQRGTEMPRTRELPTVPVEARTATLGRRSCTLPPRPDPMAVRSATLLPKPVRNEPLHSPTSKRNQVQFTTFTTLDIKHLAALKRNGLDINWTSQDHAAGASQARVANQGGLCSQVQVANQDGECSQVSGFTQAGDCTENKGFLPDIPWPVVKPVAQV